MKDGSGLFTSCDGFMSSRGTRRIALLLLICLFSTLLPAWAQTPNSQPQGPLSTTAPEYNLWQTIINGGWVMVAILALSVVVMGCIVNYFITIRQSRLIPKDLLRRIFTMINENNFQDAIALCESAGGFIPLVVAEGLKRRGKEPEKIVAAMEVTGRREADYLRQKTRFLLDMATLAPLLGLLGTVLGMIQAFNVIALDPAVVKPILLAEAVSKALVTTAAGLIIAIPAMAFYFFFRGRVQVLVALMEDISEEFSERITEIASRNRN